MTGLGPRTRGNGGSPLHHLEQFQIVGAWNGGGRVSVELANWPPSLCFEPVIDSLTLTSWSTSTLPLTELGSEGGNTGVVGGMSTGRGGGSGFGEVESAEGEPGADDMLLRGSPKSEGEIGARWDVD